jgi:hypothetical protein
MAVWSAWVIESDRTDLRPTDPRLYMTCVYGPAGMVPVWDNDIDEAVQFIRQQDAIRVAAMLNLSEFVLTEHVFSSGEISEEEKRKIDVAHIHGGDRWAANTAKDGESVH